MHGVHGSALGQEAAVQRVVEAESTGWAVKAALVALQPGLVVVDLA